MPNGFGIEVLILLSSAAPACPIGASWLLFGSLSLTIFGLTYYYLHRWIAKHQHLEANLSEERLRMALDAACMGIWNWDILTGKIDWSEQHAELFGLTPESFDGTYEAFERCLHPEDREAMLQAVNHAIQEKSIYSHQYRVIWPDGSIHWVEGKGQCFYDQTGRAVRMTGTIMDISDRIAAQKALVVSEKRLRTMIDAEPQCVKVLLPDGKIQEMNAAGLAMIEADDLQQVIGQPASSLVVPKYRDAFTALVQQALQGNSGTLEFEIMGLRGTRRWLETYAVPLRNEKNEIIGVLGITRDITACKQTAADLRHSEEQLRLALEAARMGIWDWNVLTNQITASSHCEQLFGLNPGTFGGTYEAFKACIYPEDLKPIIQAVNKSRLEQQDYHHEFRVVWPDDSIHWLEGKGRFFYDETGQAVRMLGTVMDISDRKRAEAELRESEAKFRQFAENIHEVFWMSNADVSEILYVSPAYEQIWGRSCESLYANPKSFLDAIYPDDKPEAIENVERHATGIFDTEYRIIRPDGSMRWIHDRGFPIRNEFGEIYRRAGIAQDITQRKHAEAILRQVNEDLERRVAERTAKLEQANEQLQRELLERERVERALRKSEERWQLAIRGSNDGIWDLNLKRDRCFYSARWREMLGYEEHEISDSSREWAMLVHPDDLERVSQARQAHLERKTPHYIAEYRMRCKDGSYKWILSRAQAVWDEAGNPVRMVGSHSDISDRKQAEETLRKQACIFENLYDAVILTDLDGRIIDWNPAAERIFGYSKAEVLGKTPAILHRTEKSSLLTGEVFQEMLNAGRWVGEINFVRKDGTEGVCETVVVPLYNEQGEAIATIGVNKDISDAYRQATQRKQAEAERAKLIAILEATPDVVAHASLDQKVHYLNSAGRNILGLDENENLANLTIRDCHPQWAYEILRDEGIPTAIQEGAWVGETAFLSHDGQEIPVSQLLIAHKSPDGSVNLLSTVARDITQQKQIAATLLEAERRWRSLLENVRLGVVGLDKNGKIEYVNHYFLELVGYTKAEVLNKDWFETFLPHHLRHREQNSFLELLEHEFYTHDRNVILTKSGEERVIAWNNTLLQDLQGYVIGSLSIGEDITERQVIERMKDEFISVVSHELRTPLTSIHGALNLLSSGLVNTQTEKGRRVIEIAAESAERLVRLVNDILELERLESGKISLLKQRCNAAELMQKAIEMIQVMANRAGISLSISPQAIEFTADGDRIIQVLTNLLGNAIKFSNRGSTVWLSVELSNELRELRSGDFPITNYPSPITHPTILFTIKDQGRGIPADKLDSIFERFHQVDASDSRKKGGTGLGLAICRSIVQQHGGQIWVESTLSEGSSFYFTLPVALENSKHGNQAHLGD